MSEVERPDLDAIEALANAATPGRWEWWTSNSWRRLKTNDDKNVAEPYLAVSDRHPDLMISEADMSFIAAARTDVPALVAYARRLEAELQAWRSIDPLETVSHPGTSPDRIRKMIDELARTINFTVKRCDKLRSILARIPWATIEDIAERAPVQTIRDLKREFDES